MYTIYKLTIASIKMFLRSRQALFFSLIMPFVIMFIFGFIGFDTPPQINVGLVTHSPNTETAIFVERLRETSLFSIHEGSLEEERAALDEGDRSIVLDVPNDLIQSETSAGTKTVEAYIHAGQEGQARAVLSILNQQFDEITLEEVNAPKLFAIEEHEINAHNLRYIEFLLPGLIALSIMQMSVFSVAFVFTEYKEKGILRRLLAAPMRPFQFVAANVIMRLLVSVSQAIIFIIAGVVLFGTQVVGSYPLVFMIVSLGALMFLGLGFSVSGIAKTVDSVPALANIVVFPMIFLGGAFFPITNMPGWLQAIAQFLPLTYFSSALRQVMTEGASIFAIRGDILGMVVWAAILITLATYLFGFQRKDGA